MYKAYLKGPTWNLFRIAVADSMIIFIPASYVD